LILPPRCPRINTGCYALESRIGQLQESYHDKCERMEEYIYCEYYSTGMVARSANFNVMQIVQSTRRR
jgi:hypothetical protein